MSDISRSASTSWDVKVGEAASPSPVAGCHPAVIDEAAADELDAIVDRFAAVEGNATAAGCLDSPSEHDESIARLDRTTCVLPAAAPTVAIPGV